MTSFLFIKFIEKQEALKNSLKTDTKNQFWEFIDYSDLELGAVLGEGSFGE